MAVELMQAARKADTDNTSADARRSAEIARKGGNLGYALDAFCRPVARAQKSDSGTPVVRSSNGIQSVLGGIGLDMVAAPRTQVARKADLDRTALDLRVRSVSGLSDDAARLLDLTLKAYERAGSREGVNLAPIAIAEALGVTATQAEAARNELALKGLIREALNSLGGRAGWVPRLPR